MKNKLLYVLAVLSLTGCVTRKIPVMPEATNITPISESVAIQQQCQIIQNYTLGDNHPNNVTPALKNEAYLAGANRYRIAEILATRRGRPSSVAAVFYSCPMNQEISMDKVKLLPEAQLVTPMTFTEIENNDCKVLTTDVAEKTETQSVEDILKEKTYMQGGNRFHVTKIIKSEDGVPESVIADLYRCKTRTMAYDQN